MPATRRSSSPRRSLAVLLLALPATVALAPAAFAGPQQVAQVTAAPDTDKGVKVPDSDLMAAQALPDIVQGKADAPVTVIEYASMTCTHCAHFHETTYPALIKDYVDAGKVRFILREFPLDPLATAGFMLARCEGADKRTAVVDLLFDTQKSWAFVDKPLEALEGVLKQTGMSKDQFEACLKDQKLYDRINEVRDRGAQKFGVTATPTFYINGQKKSGEIAPSDLPKLLDPLTTKKS